jgi:predicted RNA-binding protein YlxR (DUF448 family)/ribosomal protein L7Ae-like RNA K-turn-binding protein
MAEPIRQCIACRQRKPKKELLRIVRINGREIEFDPPQKKQGRGLYICPTSACIEKTRGKELINRAWGIRTPRHLFIRLAKYIHSQQSDLEKILGFAARTKKLVTGVESVGTAIKKKRVLVVVLDSNTGESTRIKIEALSRKWGVPLVFFTDELSISHIIGKANCRCIGITEESFAKSILSKANPMNLSDRKE